MGRMIGKLSEERTCYVSIALLEIVSELTKCPPTIDEKGLLIKATYPLTGLEVYVRLPAYGLDAGSVSSLECAHDDILDPHLASPVFTGFQCKCMKQPDNTIRVFLLKTEVKND